MDFNKINEKIQSLKPDILNINKDIKDAVEITKIQKDFSVASLRKIAEKILSSLYEKEYGQPPKETMLQKVKNQLLSREALPRRIKNYVDTIQDFGNMSAHHTGENLETEDIEMCFMSLISIYKWYIEKYSGTSTNIPIEEEKPTIQEKIEEKPIKATVTKEEEVKTQKHQPETKTEKESETKPKKKGTAKKVFITILIIFILGGIGYIAYRFVPNFINDNPADQQNTNNTNNNITTDNSNTTTENNTNNTIKDNNTTSSNNVVKIKANQWTEVCRDNVNKPSPRRYFAMSYIEDGKAILFGGEDEDGSLSNETWIYDDSKQNWAKVEYAKDDKYPEARIHTAIAPTNDGRVVLFGGRNIDRKNLSDTWIFDIKTKKWAEVSINDENSPTARFGHSLAYTGNGKVILFGGSQAEGSRYQYDLKIFDIQNNLWSEYEIKSIYRPDERVYQSMCYAGNDSILLFGGKKDKIRADTWMFNYKSKEWKKTIESKDEDKTITREKHSMQYINENTIVMFGGTNGNPLKETWFYDIAKNEWKKQPLSSNPPARFGHSIAYLGDDKVVMFGGCADNSGDKLLNDTYIFWKKG